MSSDSTPGDDTVLVFRRCLAELVRLVGVHLPDVSVGNKADVVAQRATIQQALVGRVRLPEVLFDALLRAAVHDPDPSFNRQFVDPAVAAYGRRRVQETLLHYLRTGSDVERAGAARAWYWAQVRLVYKVSASLELGEPTPESKAEADAYEDLWDRWKEAALREFVTTQDLDVRRCILPGLPLNPADFPEHLHGLVAEAVYIARTHPDAYLRHRVEHQV